MIGDLSRPASRSRPLWKLGLLGRSCTPPPPPPDCCCCCALTVTAAAMPIAVVVFNESVRPPADLFTTIIISTPRAFNRNTHLRSSSRRYRRNTTANVCDRPAARKRLQQRHNMHDARVAMERRVRGVWGTPWVHYLRPMHEPTTRSHIERVYSAGSLP